MDPLYPPGLDENRAVDNLYAASLECSETTLLHWKKIVLCSRLSKCSVRKIIVL